LEGIVQHRLWLVTIGLLAATVTVRSTSATSSAVALIPQAAAAKAAPTPPSQPPQAAPQAGYVGSAACIKCHTDQGDTFMKTPHGQAKNSRTPESAQGCETCHGPGKAHTDDQTQPIRTFSKKAPDEMNQVCLTCHNRGEHAGWEGSKHEQRGLACGTCHSVHSFKSPTHQLIKPTQTAVCATCHRLQVTKTERAVAHMPVREGKLQCSSCHSPHGSISNVKSLKTGSSVVEMCTTCHAEMRAPMLWEHAPVKENCATCHDPHGSSNDRMLVVRMPMLCQRCHSPARHPSTIYDNNAITVNKSNRMFGRSCVNCHSNIHGSNHPSGQFFMR
jgi:DmsE family decaheme c-type cytochrome